MKFFALSLILISQFSSHAIASSKVIADCTGPQTTVKIIRDGDQAFTLDVRTAGYAPFVRPAFIVPAGNAHDGLEVNLESGTTFTFTQSGFSNRITRGFLSILEKNEFRGRSIALICTPKA